MTVELGRDVERHLVALDAVADAAMAGPLMRQRLSSYLRAAGVTTDDHVWPCRRCLDELKRELSRVATAGMCWEHDPPEVT